MYSQKDLCIILGLPFVALFAELFPALLADSWPGCDAQLIHGWPEIGRCDNGVPGINTFLRFRLYFRSFNLWVGMK